MRIICILLTVYWVILIVRILSSWFRPPMSGPLQTVWRIVYDLTDPVLRPFRNLLPAMRMGSMAIDFSPIIVFIILGVLQRVVCR
jgi:YggT family protein